MPPTTPAAAPSAPWQKPPRYPPRYPTTFLLPPCTVLIERPKEPPCAYCGARPVLAVDASSVGWSTSVSTFHADDCQEWLCPHGLDVHKVDCAACAADPF